MKKKHTTEKPEIARGQAQTLAELEEMNRIDEYIESSIRKIGNDVDQEITEKFISPKYTVRGEHNVWHVYRNDERLEPPFRNQQRAETERAHHERSHAIRHERTQRND